MRVNLTVAVSPDRGKNWAILAQIEEVPGSRAYYASAPINRPLVHYPTMLQRGCHLYVAYSVAFKEWEKKEKAEAGIRVARLDLSFTRRRCQHSPRCAKERRRGRMKLQRHCKHLEVEQEFLLLLDSDTLSECESVRENSASSLAAQSTSSLSRARVFRKHSAHKNSSSSSK